MKIPTLLRSGENMGFLIMMKGSVCSEDSTKSNILTIFIAIAPIVMCGHQLSKKPIQFCHHPGFHLYFPKYKMVTFYYLAASTKKGFLKMLICLKTLFGMSLACRTIKQCN